MKRGPVAEIDLSALDHNRACIQRLAGSRELIAVVKADAYGHGAREAAGALQAAGVGTFAVAYAGEALSLRDAGITAKILVLFDRTDHADYFPFQLTPVVHDLRTAKRFDDEASRRMTRIDVHLKVDTGMGRVGFLPETLGAGLGEILALRNVRVTGLMSHFSEADLADRSFALEQIVRFSGIKDVIERASGTRLFCHFANSAAIFSLPEALFDGIRPGIALYGYGAAGANGLRPVMRVSTEVLVVRDLPEGTPVSYGRTFITKRKSRIAVLPVGYADGFIRALSNRAAVLIRSRRVPVVGRVCMDAVMADVTDLPEVCEGDEAVILGSQGGETISADEIAGRAGTISYEVLTSLGSRARRIFHSA